MRSPSIALNLAARRVLATGSRLVVLFLVSAGGLLAQQSIAPQRPPILGKGAALGLSYDCGTIDAALLTRSAAAQTLCPLLLLGGAAFYTDQIRGDDLLVALNKEGAMVAVHNRTAEATSSFSGTIDHTGQQEDVVHWGLWRSGTIESLPSRRRFTVDESTAVPYIVGVSAHSVATNDRAAGRLHRLSDLPADVVATYTLVGETGVVSRQDTQGNVVPVGKVHAAHATIDFKNRTGQLDLTIEVRGTTAMIQLPIEPQNKILGFSTGGRSTGGPCRRPAPEEYCPAADGQFFGRDGQYLGITFSYGHNAVLPEAASVAAHLNNVLAQGAVVLRRD
jgi:hypothetical protein